MGGPELYACEEMPSTGMYSLSVGKRRRSKTWVGVLRQSTQMELEDRFDWLRQGLVSREGLVPVI